MGYKATHRLARINPRKVRPLANLIRGKRVDDALAVLQFQPQRGARLLEKVLQSAMGNAEDQRAPNMAGLKVIEARVDGGPLFKRVRPRARGMAHIITRQFSHIHIEVE